MKLYYDLHIHTCLSPCGDADMTPNNIVNMALLKGLDVIAITDHNTCGNAGACMACADGTGLLVIPGLEVETAEEVHMVCLFPVLSSAQEMEKIVRAALPAIPNRVEIFGPQCYMDANDHIIAYEDNLLVTATRLSCGEVVDTVRRLGGSVFPAHVDKDSYSMLSNLGAIPKELGFSSVEVHHMGKLERIRQQIAGYQVLHNSDAHYLWDISEPVCIIEAEKKTVAAVLHVV